jgi:NTE family protein
MSDPRVDYKIGLALGGGAARGWSHIGVLRTLAKAGIHPDIIVGTSIGAVVGGCYVAGELDELETFARSLTRRKVLGFLDFNFTGAGLINGDRLCSQLDTKLRGQTIETLPRKYTAVATEMGTGHEVWLSRGSLVDAMRASYALPGIFKPVERDGRWLFDGAMVNPVPVSVARALGARYVIAVNLNADMAERGTMAPIRDTELDYAPAGALGLAEADATQDAAGNMIVRNGRALKKLLQRQIFGTDETAPGMSTVMMEAFNIVQDRIARSRLAGDPPDVMIAPRTSGFSLFDFHRADDLIAAGEAAAHRVLDDIAREIAIRRAPRTTRLVVSPQRPSAPAN